MKLPLALVLAALAVVVRRLIQQMPRWRRGAGTGSNIPGRVTRPSANSEGREEHIRRAEALHED